MKETDLAYAAGIIDGEGCIGVWKHKSKKAKRGYTFSLDIKVNSTDEWLPVWLRDSFGGATHWFPPRNTHRSQYWVWVITSNKASAFLQSILPYLRLKKEQAEIAIVFQKDRKHSPLKTEKLWVLEEAQSILLRSLHQKKGVKR